MKWTPANGHSFLWKHSYHRVYNGKTKDEIAYWCSIYTQSLEVKEVPFPHQTIYRNDQDHWHIEFIEICSPWSDWQYIIIDSDNYLAPNRRQAINWTKDGIIYWRVYASVGLIDLKGLTAFQSASAEMPIKYFNTPPPPPHQFHFLSLFVSRRNACLQMCFNQKV